MTKEKKELLDRTFQTFMEIGFSQYNLHLLEEIVAKDVVGFGTAIDERLFGIAQLEELLTRQKQQSAGLEMKWEVTTLDLHISSDENTAIFTNEVALEISTDRDPINMYLRFSVVLEFEQHKWVVVHWHGSKPEQVESEKDTWGLDLWKAKADELEKLIAERTAELLVKNRELEVEAALERVRAKTMAMEKSEELGDVATVLFRELNSLVDDLWTCGFVFCEENREEDEWWLSLANGLIQPFFLPNVGDFTHEALYKGWENGEAYRTVTLENEMLKEHYDWLMNIPIARQIFDEMEGSGIPRPNWQRLHAAYFKTGYLVVITEIPYKEEEIFKRFAQVFDLTYTRFLDLQKAEAQAREAQIEAALERVRSRSMAMHKSEELKEVIRVVLEQFGQLNMNVGHAGFYIDYHKHDEMHIWLADPNIEPFFAILPYFDTPTWNSFLEAKAKGITLHTDLLDFETKNQFYSSLFELFTVPEEAKGFYLACKGLAVSTVLLDTVGLYIENFDAVPYTDEENTILIRFGKVFQQTYTRFLDLQKAEAQEREAQIEAALERVRSRAMAMHSSNELNEVVHELRKQMGILGQKNLETCVIHLHDELPDYIQSWAAIKPPGEEGEGVQSIANVPKKGLMIIEEALDAYKGNKKDYVIINEGEKLNQWFAFLEKEAPDGFTKLAESVKGNVDELRAYWSFADFSGGSLLMVTRDDPDEATRGLLRRFSNVFGLAYRRFADFKQAEAQAKEAQIEAALEKVRSTSLAMHKAEELKNVVAVVFQKLKELGLRFDVAGIQLYTKDSKDIIQWVAAPDFLAAPALVHFPYVEDDFKASEIIRDYWAAKEMGKSFSNKQYSFEEKNRFFEYAGRHNDLTAMPEDVREFQLNAPKYTQTLVAEKRSALWVDSYSGQTISSGDIDILKRFIRVFEQAYIRFLDLQKAESQAREAQIEAALEKVRSRTMAMQSSDELADAAYVLFEQLKSLGVTHERINIGIVNEENQTIDFWITEQGGDKLSTKFSGRISEPTTLAKAYSAWKLGARSLVVDLNGDELKTWLNYLNDEIKIPFNKAFLHKRRVQTAGFFSKGMLIVTSPEPLQEEGLYLLEKFAGVFDLTYTRFNDLKIAEAHALQAERDLIEIKIARQKAEEALAELKATQTQLIQQEKLASLGQLTAGIAHEIKNPLNFVNNFSEVSLELVGEIRVERTKNQESRDESLVDEILEDIKANLEKIHEHGSRANGIVTSMLQHSRGGSGKKEPTDLNALIKEYVNLSFHGMRAGKNPINVEIDLDLDPEIGEVSLIKEDFTRVIINLCNNAFDAMRATAEMRPPKLTIRTKHQTEKILISLEDNGPGIPDEIKDKILQPFFTTKKGTEGTGLGLSITHDIVKAHGGTMEVNSEYGKNAEFRIELPV